mmetsp:Transcript_64847/g.187982  ORF Transcript_64847/g.187982 Transcript_64847/m.187982 type:complete len:242 (-) Transcript_64847:719-1444(-)
MDRRSPNMTSSAKASGGKTQQASASRTSSQTMPAQKALDKSSRKWPKSPHPPVKVWQSGNLLKHRSVSFSLQTSSEHRRPSTLSAFSSRLAYPVGVGSVLHEAARIINMGYSNSACWSNIRSVNICRPETDGKGRASVVDIVCTFPVARFVNCAPTAWLPAVMSKGTSSPSTRHTKPWRASVRPSHSEKYLSPRSRLWHSPCSVVIAGMARRSAPARRFRSKANMYVAVMSGSSGGQSGGL